MLLLRAVAKQCYMWQRATPDSVSSLFQSAHMAGGTGGTDDTTSLVTNFSFACGVELPAVGKEHGAAAPAVAASSGDWLR